MDPKKFSELSDTSPEVEEIQLTFLRKLTPAQRAVKVFSLSEQLITLSKRAIQRQNPELNEFELKILYLHYFYGADIAQKVKTYLNADSSSFKTMKRRGQRTRRQSDA